MLATAKNHEQRHLARRLKRFGNFRWSPYHGLLMGIVEDRQAFLEHLRNQEERRPGYLYPLARLVPLDHTFPFTMDTLVPRLKAEVQAYADRIGNGSFYVRVERRGHKAEVQSRAIEEALAGEIFKSSAQPGSRPRVAFDDPDFIVVVEIVADECGVGLIPKVLREQNPFVKVG